MRNTLRKNKGITLIALVITIIVLIILAGVSLSLVLGNNGIITKAKDAKKMQTLAEIQEEVNLKIFAKTIEKEEVGEKITLLEVEAILTPYGEVIKNEDETIKSLKPTGFTEEIPIEKLYAGEIEKIKMPQEGLVNYWNLGDEKCSLVVHSGTPQYQNDGTVLLDNCILKTPGDNYVLPEKFTMILELGNINFTTNMAQCTPIFGKGYTGSVVGDKYVGVLYNNSKGFNLLNGMGDQYTACTTENDNNGNYDNSKMNIFAIRYNGTKLECFINGCKISETTGISDKETPIYIGGAPTNDSILFGTSTATAKYKNFAMYNRDLSDLEINSFRF